MIASAVGAQDDLQSRTPETPSRRSRRLKVACVLFGSLVVGGVIGAWVYRQIAWHLHVKKLCRMIEAIPYGLTWKEFEDRLKGIPVDLCCEGGGLGGADGRARLSMSDIAHHPELSQERLSESELYYLPAGVYSVSLDLGTSEGRGGSYAHAFVLYEFVFVGSRPPRSRFDHRPDTPNRYVRRQRVLERRDYFSSEHDTE